MFIFKNKCLIYNIFTFNGFIYFKLYYFYIKYFFKRFFFKYFLFIIIYKLFTIINELIEFII